MRSRDRAVRRGLALDTPSPNGDATHSSRNAPHPVGDGAACEQAIEVSVGSQPPELEPLGPPELDPARPELDPLELPELDPLELPELDPLDPPELDEPLEPPELDPLPGPVEPPEELVALGDSTTGPSLELEQPEASSEAGSDIQAAKGKANVAMAVDTRRIVVVLALQMPRGRYSSRGETPHACTHASARSCDLRVDQGDRSGTRDAWCRSHGHLQQRARHLDGEDRGRRSQAAPGRFEKRQRGQPRDGRAQGDRLASTKPAVAPTPGP